MSFEHLLRWGTIKIITYLYSSKMARQKESSKIIKDGEGQDDKI